MHKTIRSYKETMVTQLTPLSSNGSTTRKTSVRAMRQQEKLAMLGKLTAGIAHELNNPTAAVRRIAQQLRTCLLTIQQDTTQIHQLDLTSDQLTKLHDWQKMTLVRSTTAHAYSALERSESEAQLGNWLFTFDLDNAWEMAETFTYFHVDIDSLRALIAQFPAQHVPVILCWLEHSLGALRLTDEVSQAAERMCELVAAIKANSHMESGPPRRVDLHKSIEDTLFVLSHKLKNIEVSRQFDSSLPFIVARGGELYQIWTNLLDNAVDALEGLGKILIKTEQKGEFVEVTFEDNGPGIAPNILPHIFEAFFTTKHEGQGTGLGLEIVQRIIIQHGGTIRVDSRPGSTRFVVSLPIHGADVDSPK
ncbi:MAG: ATP-binding protein [Caldilineaceae bacterium]